PAGSTTVPPDVDTVDQHLPLEPRESHDALDERGLARTVRADEGEHLPGLEIEGGLLQREGIPIPLRHGSDAQHVVHRLPMVRRAITKTASPPAISTRFTAATPTGIPCGSAPLARVTGGDISGC